MYLTYVPVILLFFIFTFCLFLCAERAFSEAGRGTEEDSGHRTEAQRAPTFGSPTKGKVELLIPSEDTFK